MSKKPKPGGQVQISGRRYDVLAAPVRHDGYWSLKVRHQDGTELWAETPLCQSGCGPWKISAPVIAPAES